jgi:hypothetical protein
VTDDHQYDPYDLARRHYRENLWLRSLLAGVAQELERMAASSHKDHVLGIFGPSERVCDGAN